MTEAIKAKIAKLLNLAAKGSGATEDEAETALRMAAAMAARAGIELEACRAKDAPKPKINTKGLYQEWKPHQAYAACAAAKLFGVECNVYNLGAGGIMFVGRDDLIEATEETMFWLFRQIEELYKSHLPKGLTKSARADFRKSFKAACANRVLGRAQQLMRDMKANNASAQAATGQNALVVAGYFETLEKEIEGYWDERLEAGRKRQEERRAALLAGMTEAARIAFLAEEEKTRKIADKEAANRKGRAGRQMPTGSGTNAGFRAGELVKFRKEINA